MLKFIREITEVIVYLIRSLSEGFTTHFDKLRVSPERRLHVLANGPSLNIFLGNIQNNKTVTKECDFIAINDFINDNRCLEIKPKYYVLSDPMFFFETRMKERGLKVINGLAEKVDWNMILFVRHNVKNADYLSILVKNKNIKIEYYHSYHYPLFNDLVNIRRFIFRRGWGNGEYSTVALNAIYIGITLGYKEIFLQGVDHTFFSGLTVNEENIPCYIYKHSFDTNELVKPMEWHYDEDHSYKTMPYFLKEMYSIFQGHWVMADYAQSVGTKVWNCTNGSLIDAYPRLTSQ